MKVEEKYNNQNDDGDSSSSSDEDDNSMSDDDESMEYIDDPRFEEEERILKDYDRIYPPTSDSNISRSRYREMEKFISEEDDKQQRRLTCPLQQKRTNGDVEIDFNTHGQQLSRGDGWIGGNIHIRPTKEETKILGPPTKKQVEFADRLSRGYSVEDTSAGLSDKFMKRKSRILNHHDFIYEEMNPFYHLIDRVQQSRELSKVTRKRAETKLNNRYSSKSGGALIRQKELSLGLQIPLVVREHSSKFYKKRRGVD